MVASIDRQRRARVKSARPSFTKSITIRKPADAEGLTPVASMDRVIPIIASSTEIDSYNESIDQASWRLARFLKNPIALWQHSPWLDSPGFYRNIRVEDGVLRADLVLYTEDVSAEAEKIWKRYQQGGPVALSVGFDAGRDAKEERGGMKVRVLYDCDLKEISVVTIGANPDAVAERKSARAAWQRQRPRKKGTSSMKTLTECMADKGMTGDSLAEKVGLSKEDVSGMLAGTFMPTSEQASKIAKELAVDEADLMAMLAALQADEEEEDDEPVVDEEAKSAKSSLAKIFTALTAKNTGEALAKIRALSTLGEEHKTLSARVRTLEAERQGGARDKMLETARIEGVLTPARERRAAEFLKTASIAQLRAYLDALTPAVSTHEREPKELEPEAMREDPKLEKSLQLASEQSGIPIEKLREEHKRKKARDARQ